MRLQLEDAHRDGERRDRAHARGVRACAAFVRAVRRRPAGRGRAFLRKGRVIHRVDQAAAAVNGGARRLVHDRLPRAPRGPDRGPGGARGRRRSSPPCSAEPQWLARAANRDLSSRRWCACSRRACASCATRCRAAARFDSGTARAVMAYRKVRGPGPHVLRRRARSCATCCAGAAAFDVRYPEDGRHVEADLSRQVLALIEGDEVGRIYHIVLRLARTRRRSSGASACTASRRARTRTGMVHSSYFIGGYAIHGYVACRRTTRATAACACRSRTRGRSTSWLGHGRRRASSTRSAWRTPAQTLIEELRRHALDRRRGDADARRDGAVLRRRQARDPAARRVRRARRARGRLRAPVGGDRRRRPDDGRRRARPAPRSPAAPT